MPIYETADHRFHQRLSIAQPMHEYQLHVAEMTSDVNCFDFIVTGTDYNALVDSKNRNDSIYKYTTTAIGKHKFDSMKHYARDLHYDVAFVIRHPEGSYYFNFNPFDIHNFKVVDMKPHYRINSKPELHYLIPVSMAYEVFPRIPQDHEIAILGNSLVNGKYTFNNVHYPTIKI